MTHGPAHDPPQHVPPPLIRRRDAVGDEEGGGARVVGDDAHGDVLLLLVSVGLPRQPLDVADERPEEVGLVVRVLPLHDRGDALEPHARVDGGLGQRRHDAARVAVELHEDEVPDLEPSVAIAGGPQAGSAGLLLRAGQMIALVEMHLRARPARARVAHRPEVVLLAQAQDAVLPQPRHLLPEREGVVVVREHGRREAGRRQAEVAGQQLPAERHGIRLEVVAEGEVAEHLEERMVARRAADILEVIVLAARPDAFLGGGRPDVVAPLLAEEHALELHHARIGEEQCRVLTRDEGGGAHHGMAVLREVVEKTASEIIAGHHGRIILIRRRPSSAESGAAVSRPRRRRGAP